MAQDESLWYKDAIVYEVHVRSFFDSDGDGIGDFQGLSEKLDYIEDLGVTALWLLPFYPSPLKDDGYDIADYTDVHPNYGTLNDFQNFLDEAHRRGLKVITELVLNHTSDQHPWFQRARHAPPGSVERDFYVWSDTPDKYTDARIIFSDYKTSNWTWDPIARAYYWHRFFAHQPDLNFDNPEVQKAVFEFVDLWLSMGIDGMRLDAITYLYEREGTNCESLPETHEFLQKLRRHIDERFAHRMLLAEANQWPEDAVDYFGENDECHMTFHFPLMPRLFMSVQMEDRYPIIDIIEQTPELPFECQWATFLRNHDELTLEMVTDEERDFMYRAFAPEIRMRVNLGIRRRLAPLLKNDRRKIELLYGLLFAIGGTPIIYYGDEIGMGDNYHLGDRDGVRTPMQWSADRNAGFSQANPQSLYLPVIVDPEYHYYAVNVENQENNPTSMLSWLKRLIAARKRHPAFARGDIEFLHQPNEKVLSFVRSYERDTVLVVANLSRSAQHVALEMPHYSGRWPVELGGRTEFPRIEEDAYHLTLGPYAFYWFSLETERLRPEVRRVTREQLPALEVKHEWTSIFDARVINQTQENLQAYLPTQRWFEGQGRRLESVEIMERLRLRWDSEQAVFTLLEARFANGDTDIYVLPIGFATGKKEREIRQQHPELIISTLCVESEDTTGILYDALASRGFCRSLLSMMYKGWESRGLEGTLQGEWFQVLNGVHLPEEDVLEPSLLQGDHAHTSVVFGRHFVLKLLRRLERGVSLDVEVGRYLTEQEFGHMAELVGHLDYHRGRWEPVSMGILTRYVPNKGTAWQAAVDALDDFHERVRGRINELPVLTPATMTLLKLGQDGPDDLARELIGDFLDDMRTLGRRTAELHMTLAAAPRSSSFAPEPFSSSYERSRYQSMRTLTMRVLRLLKKRRDRLPPAAHDDAEQVLDNRDEFVSRFRALVKRGIGGLRTRIHGDYHLQEVLRTDGDFVIIDFEGHPWLPIGERRIKRSPLRDVASMIRSIHNVALTDLMQCQAELEQDPTGAERAKELEEGAHYWYLQIAAAFLGGYLERAGDADFLPSGSEALVVFLDALRLEKALHQLERELRAEPYEPALIPLRGILALLRGIAR